LTITQGAGVMKQEEMSRQPQVRPNGSKDKTKSIGRVFYAISALSLASESFTVAYLYDAIPWEDVLIQEDSLGERIVGWIGFVGLLSAPLVLLVSLITKKRSFICIGIIVILLAMLITVQSVYNMTRL